jgi:hypothetical protein
VFAESLDLTDQKTLAAFDSFEEYWEIEWWFIWIHIEWWEIIDVPVEVTYKNAETTAYAPKVVAKEPDTSDIAKVTESKPGESKITVSGPGRVEIVPNVVFEGDNNVTSTNNNYTFNVSTSHKNLEYIVKINGTEVELKPENADWEKGTFQFTARNLNNSKNDVELLYKQKDAKEFISAGKKTVTIEEEKGWINASGTVSLSMLVLLFLLGVITSGVLLVGGFLVYRYNLIGKLLQRIRKA